MMRTMATMLMIVGVAVTVGACSEETAPEPQAAPRSESAAQMLEGGGMIEAVVKYTGAPVIETIRINKDPKQCGTEATIDQIVVGPDDGLRNAVVSVVGATGPRTAKKAQLDQRGCEFQPQVVAMQPGKIEIMNSDGILHNIRTYSTANDPINKAQPKFKKVMTETFDQPEIIKVTCDVHSWMLGWIVVLPHPYFGVTDGRGVTRLEHVPPGRHTVEVWHPELGKRQKVVEVQPEKTTTVVFELDKKAT